jgi:signal transduction histidine kinase
VRSQAFRLVQLRKLASRNLKKILIALGVLLGVLLVVGLILYGHSQIRTDLRYALASASAELSPLLVAYDTEGEFNGREVLELTQPEIQQAVRSWPSFNATIYLQVFNVPEKVLFDSRQGTIRSYEKLEPISSHLQHGTWDKRGPFLYVDWVPPQKSRWILRAAVTAPSYFFPHAWRLPLVLLLLSVMGKLASIQIEVRRRRRFDRLVGSMPVLLRQAQEEETLIPEVPKIIAYMLDFDSVAIYLLEGDHIVPKGYFSKAEQDHEAFMNSTAKGSILIQADDPESRAIRENQPIIVHNPQTGGAIRPFKDGAVASRPYVIVPIRRGGDGLPVGLLTAQRHAGLEEQHKDFLESCSEIVALLLDNVRGREKVERLYRKMIRNTRIETLGTIVPFITHNMKSPLVAVEGLVDSLSKDFGILDYTEFSTRIAQIKAQTDLCFQLIRSISQYNRLGNAQASTVNLRQGLAKVCGFFERYFRIKNILLEQHYPDGFEPNVHMAELDFVQVITNLLINADEAFADMPGASEFSQRRLKITIILDLMAEDREAKISIIDNGPGISAEVLPRVFEQDFTTRGDFGSGVGLPYCRRVVEEAGGKIGIASTQGIGTTVSILIPTTKGEVPEDEYPIGG